MTKCENTNMRCVVSGLDLVHNFTFSMPLPSLPQEVEVVRLDEGQYADCTGV